MKFLGFDKVLCLSPHPDDVEYSMGATIIKHYDTQFDILCLTQGGDCDKTTSAERLKEVKKSWESTNIINIELFFTKFKYLKDLGEDEWINYIEKHFTNINDYDCIITPSEIDSHFEHRFVSGIGPALIRSSLISLLQYESPSTQPAWIPNMFNDITEAYKLKLRMLKQFESQQERSYFSQETLDGFHTHFQCSKKGMKYVERFKIINYSL